MSQKLNKKEKLKQGVTVTDLWKYCFHHFIYKSLKIINIMKIKWHVCSNDTENKHFFFFFPEIKQACNSFLKKKFHLCLIMLYCKFAKGSLLNVIIANKLLFSW